MEDAEFTNAAPSGRPRSRGRRSQSVFDVEEFLRDIARTENGCSSDLEASGGHGSMDGGSEFQLQRALSDDMQGALTADSRRPAPGILDPSTDDSEGVKRPQKRRRSMCVFVAIRRARLY